MHMCISICKRVLDNKQSSLVASARGTNNPIVNYGDNCSKV